MHSPIFRAAALCFAFPCLLYANPGLDQFESQIRPLLVQKCLECHSGKTPEGKLDLASKKGFEQGGMNGPLIVAGDAQSSSLYQRLITENSDLQMPPEERLSPAEIEAVKTWLHNGAPWPSADAPLAPAAPSKGSDHWAFQPLQPVTPPQVQNEGWCQTDIDRFILAKLTSTGLPLSPDADKSTWLRRATLDLTGLVPSLAALQAFEEDSTPNASSDVIAKLLSSRAYAERYARRWLDVARYADTSGDGTDTPIPEARYYRDWVIDAMDRDMPYDQFLIEQIAGDLIAKQQPENPDNYQHIIATGYIALSRRFGNSKFAEVHQIIDDSIDTIGKSTMGLSLGCARCHHHKFDPVTMEDYYGIYGYFSSTQYPHAGTEHQKERSDMPSIVIPPARSDAMESNVAWAVSDKEKTGDAQLHIAGDPSKRGPAVPRGYLAFLNSQQPQITATESGRLQFAQWIASRSNPLTARVMVNRIWQSHFGRGLVANPNNFGVQSPAPSHPELLDYLANEFIHSGWSIKHIHQLIMNSHVYRLSSTPTQEATQIDQANQFLSHFPRQRMDAETFRDSILMLSGKLKEGSNGRHPFKPTEALKYNQGAPFSEVFDHEYRSVYLMSPRLNRHPMMALFDAADANTTTGERGESTVPLQSLFVINGEFIKENANALASRICEYSNELPVRADFAYHLVFGRACSQDESQSLARYIERYKSSRSQVTSDPMLADEEAWNSIARVLIGSNEFMYVD